MLARLLAESRDELEADFQQYYGLDLRGMGHDYSVAHAAVLAAQLPPHSRVAIKLNPDAAWSDERMLLEMIDYHVRYFMWMFSTDGAKNMRAPELPTTPSRLKELEEQREETKRNREKVDRILGIHNA